MATCPQCFVALVPFMGGGVCPSCFRTFSATDLGYAAAPAPPAPPAHLTGKVIGFRAWTLKGYKLMSNAGEWAIGVNTAECRRDVFEDLLVVEAAPDHEVPDHRCTCGLYAWYATNVWSLDAAGDERVFGAVTAWGHIEAQAAGFRSQYAEPVVLAYHDEQPHRHVMNLKAIAQEMRVPCVPLKELEREAERHGQRIPAELRPALPLPDMRALPGGGYVSWPAGGYVSWQSSIRSAPAPRRPRWRIGAAVNTTAGLLNLTFFILRGQWFNLVSACVLLTLAALFLLRGWRGPPT